MSAVQLDVSVLAYAIAGLIALCASAFGFGKFLLSSYDRRASERDTQLGNTLGDQGGRISTLERELLLFKAELPQHYVRREDHVRSFAIVDAKLDSIADKITRVQIEGARRHD